MPTPFAPFVIAAAVKARVRNDGGPLEVVHATTKDGRAFTSETLCPYDAGILERELTFNGFADVVREKIR